MSTRRGLAAWCEPLPSRFWVANNTDSAMFVLSAAKQKGNTTSPDECSGFRFPNRKGYYFNRDGGRQERAQKIPGDHETHERHEKGKKAAGVRRERLAKAFSSLGPVAQAFLPVPPAPSCYRRLPTARICCKAIRLRELDPPCRRYDYSALGTI